jgi:hypothetical protein
MIQEKRDSVSRVGQWWVPVDSEYVGAWGRIGRCGWGDFFASLS